MMRVFRSGKSQEIIILGALSGSIQKCQELGLETRPLKLRLIRLGSEAGKSEIFINSLINPEAWQIYLFAELYHWRWTLDEDYKVIRS